uniref:Secreted protein n=1 Tax=Glycine max TaxID=3847 RepID=C6TN76_SOYBN|nr:unknown [Glycine max]
MKERVHLMVVFVVVVAEAGEGAEVMALFQLIMRMEVGIAIGEMLGAGVEEEDVAFVVVEGEGTMGPMLTCKMEDTTKMYLKAVVVAVAGGDIVEGVVASDRMGQSK